MTQAFEPCGAVVDNVWHIAQRLDVVDNCRLPPQPDDLREGRLSARCGAFALQGVEQSRFFPADIASSTNMEMEFQAVRCPQNVASEIASAIRFGDGPGQQVCGAFVGPAQENVSDVSLNGIGTDNHAFQQLVRVALEQQAVFEGAR